MALIKCKECGAQVSSEAKACPECGKGVTSSMKWGVLIGQVFIGIIISSFSSKNTSDTGSPCGKPPMRPRAAIFPN